jgi:hypothetical protein
MGKRNKEKNFLGGKSKQERRKRKKNAFRKRRGREDMYHSLCDLIIVV